CQHYYSTPLIF
nr:immunoglobulin light chain junction region [Macaca mulatta]